MKNFFKKLFAWAINKQANEYENSLRKADTLELAWAGL